MFCEPACGFYGFQEGRFTWQSMGTTQGMPIPCSASLACPLPKNCSRWFTRLRAFCKAIYGVIVTSWHNKEPKTLWLCPQENHHLQEQQAPGGLQPQIIMLCWMPTPQTPSWDSLPWSSKVIIFFLQKSLLWETKSIWLWHDMEPSTERSSIFYHSKMMELNSLAPNFSTANSAVLIKPAAVSLPALFCSLKWVFVSVTTRILQCLPPSKPS